MDWALRLSSFYEKARADNRISPVHISLYFALLQEASNAGQDSFALRRDKIMDQAKISSRVTYNKCLRELQQYGYIDYRPSFTPGRSVVRVVDLE